MGMPIRYAFVLAAGLVGLSGCHAFDLSDIKIWPAGPLNAPPAPPSASEEAQRVARRSDQVSISAMSGQELNGGIALWFVLVAPESILPRAAAGSEDYGHFSNGLSGTLDSSLVELVADSGRVVSIQPEKWSVPSGVFVNVSSSPRSVVRREGDVAIWTGVARVRTDEPCPPGKYRIRLRGDWDPGAVIYTARSIAVDREWREIVIDPMPEKDFRSAPRH